MTNLEAIPPLASGGGATGHDSQPATPPAAARSNTPAPGGPPSTLAAFGTQVVRGLELAIVAGLGTFSSSPVLTAGNVTAKNYAAAGVAAGFAALWTLARALGYSQGTNNN
jgi:hypothetical protein